MILLSLVACFSLDGIVVPGDLKDAYELTSEVIPADRFEVVSFPSTDGATLFGLWARQPDAAGPPLIWFHGNGGALDHDFDRVETYWSWGYDVFAFDYRGYGRSEPERDADGLLEQDGLAAVRFVADATGLAPEEIPWIALSLGAAVAVHTNDEIGARAVVIENMFPSVDLLGKASTQLDLPVGWFFDEDYDNLAQMPTVQSPIYVIHGLADDFIDPAYGPRVYEAAADNPKWLWQPEEAAHADIHRVIPDAYRERVQRFFADPFVDPNLPR